MKVVVNLQSLTLSISDAEKMSEDELTKVTQDLIYQLGHERFIVESVELEDEL